MENIVCLQACRRQDFARTSCLQSTRASQDRQDLTRALVTGRSRRSSGGCGTRTDSEGWRKPAPAPLAHPRAWRGAPAGRSCQQLCVGEGILRYDQASKPLRRIFCKFRKMLGSIGPLMACFGRSRCRGWILRVRECMKNTHESFREVF